MFTALLSFIVRVHSGPERLAHPDGPETFRLVRVKDVSGVSGVGHVANGYLWRDDFTILEWLGDWPTYSIHLKGLRSVLAIHGHNGATQAQFAPLEVPNEVWVVRRAMALASLSL